MAFFMLSFSKSVSVMTSYYMGDLSFAIGAFVL